MGPSGSILDIPYLILIKSKIQFILAKTCIMAKKKHGGARSGAGRKPVDDPKIQLPIYPLKSAVDKLGVDKAKEVAVKAIYNAAKKIKDS
jgi:hypothetical protein